ncbi:MAG: zinc-dependent alcohol dehydrogenase family protein [Cytophagaceae bacterium]|nr:zinc-dependent alcohol dehydrogenase family protein [Cytophagaceae bacterium]
MKTIQFTQPGPPAEVLKLVEAELPQPGPGEVRLRVLAAPINPSDVMFVQNLYGIRPQLPSGAGFEGVGVVDALGEGVKLSPGTRVSFTGLGTWGEYTLAQARAVIPVPGDMTDDVAAQLFVNPFTAYAMILESGVQPGGWLMLTAANSAFGKLVIQFAKRKGIKTIGTVRRPDFIADLKALGADEIINTADESVTRRVKEITGGQGVTCILEAVAGKAAADVLPCLAEGGKMLVYGALSLEDMPISAGLLIFKNLTIKGFWLTAWMKTTPAEVRNEVFSTVIQWLASGEISLPVEATYSLDQIAEAVTHADRSGRGGKILVKPEVTTN